MKMKKLRIHWRLPGFLKKAAAGCLAAAVSITSLPADNPGIVFAAGTPADRRMARTPKQAISGGLWMLIRSMRGTV